MSEDEFKPATERALEPYVPKGRMEALLTINNTVHTHFEKHGKGIPLQRLINKLAYMWGTRRITIIDYIMTLCRAGQIYEYNFRLYPHLKKEAEGFERR